MMPSRYQAGLYMVATSACVMLGKSTQQGPGVTVPQGVATLVLMPSHPLLTLGDVYASSCQLPFIHYFSTMTL